ncbi:OLC1v1032122C1 [Oldenlandia corymbosa var. corymbosa]|uniref:OLC1v1032122C1 n=1 Tax=Oldenlandia corymbosa var. corymbosa TaxID=529605 RepID=A0AAV1CKH1_OLDCO|nr:OLC1v1032122C1 [Oldenlandia corymbosa var. corymbosa]
MHPPIPNQYQAPVPQPSAPPPYPYPYPIQPNIPPSMPAAKWATGLCDCCSDCSTCTLHDLLLPMCNVWTDCRNHRPRIKTDASGWRESLELQNQRPKMSPMVPGGMIR